MGSKMKRAALYVRVSRGDQNSSLQSDETAELIHRREWVLAERYADEGISGSRDRRPELDRLMDDARRGKFDVLVVYRSDRLFRSLKHMVNTLDELAALGIDYVSATEPLLDTSTPQGRLVLHLTSAFAEFERELIRDRTKAGVAAARRRGARVGRPPVRIDLARAEALKQSGKSLRAIARELGVGVATLHARLTVPKPSVQPRDPGPRISAT